MRVPAKIKCGSKESIEKGRETIFLQHYSFFTFKHDYTYTSALQLIMHEAGTNMGQVPARMELKKQLRMYAGREN